MAGPGFVFSIATPAGQPDVYIVSLLPNPSGFGEPAAIYSDNTVRNEAGAVLQDPAGLRAGSAEWQAGRQPNGQPWPAKATDPRDAASTGGVAVGELPRTDPVFIAGVLPRENVYDDPRNGGWGTPVREDGPASSQSRRDDRWVWPDGRITDAQGTVVARWTGDWNGAVYQLVGRGPQAGVTITQVGSSLVAQAVAPPKEQETETGFDKPGVDDNPSWYDGLDPDRETPSYIPDEHPIQTLGAPGTASNPTIDAAPTGAGASVTSAPGGTGGTSGGIGAFLQATTLGVPNWAWAGAAVVTILRRRGR